MSGKGKKTERGMSIKWINYSFVIVVLLFSWVIDATGRIVREKYEAVTVYQHEMILCSDAADLFRQESDNLTFYVNRYADNPDQDTIEAYYQIIDDKLREQEIEQAESLNVDCTKLRQALDLSDQLAQLETHVFALAASAAGTIDTAPEQMRNYALSPEEQQASPEEQMILAQKLVHGQKYAALKQSIYQEISDFEQSILDQTQEALMAEAAPISRYLRYQQWLELLENLLVAALAFTLYRKVTVVLDHYIQSISSNRPIETARGTRELKYLARVFNACLEMLNREHEELRHQAEKDALTQAANRRTLEEFMTRKLQQENVRGAFIFLDVDNFKSINDTYGHDAGDTVLKQLVNELNHRFRGDDFISRFGGDEFVVWLNGVDERNAELIKRRIADLNGQIVHLPQGDLPLSISAGVTYCRTGDDYKDVLRRADTALYEKKRSGKHGCVIYEELMEDPLADDGSK